MKVLAVIVLLTFLAVQDVFSGSVHDSNTYMDSIISSYLIPEMRSQDPKTLDNFNSAFKTSTLKVNVKANYTRGGLSGLTTVKRLGDCKPSYWSGPNIASLNCTLTFNKLDVKYDLRGKYGVLPTVKDAVAHGKYKETEIWVEVSTPQSNNFPQIRGFNIRNLGKFDIDYDHLSTLNTAESSLKRNFGEQINSKVLGVLNNEFRNKLAGSVSKVTMPLP